MKKYGRILCFLAVFMLLAAGPVFSQSIDGDLLRSGVDSFSNAMVKALPFSATMGLNWSDAHIGQFVALPPHFGVGFTMGATTIPLGSITGLADMLGMPIPGDLPIGFPLPGYTIEARLGGFIIPFDIGVKFGYLPQNELLSGLVGGMALKYQLIGADFRYAVIDSGLLPIRFSVGLGINHLTGGVFKTIRGFEDDFSFGIINIEVDNPELGLAWETTVLELKAHVSFPLLIITPYAGAGISYAWSNAGYQVNSRITVNGDPIEATDLEYLNGLGVGRFSSNGFERMVNAEGFNARLYGGISINVTVIRFDFTVMYNVMDPSFGGTFGVRLQI